MDATPKITKNLTKTQTYKGISAYEIEDFFINHCKLSSPKKIIQESQIVTKTYDASAVLEASKLEANRILRQARIKDGPKPFFVSVFTKDMITTEVAAAAGEVFESFSTRKRNCKIQVKVGTKMHNEFAHENIEQSRFDSNDEEVTPQPLPLSDNVEAIRHQMWPEADESFRRAVSMYYSKLSNEAAGESTLPEGSGEWTRNFNPPSNKTECQRYVCDTHRLEQMVKTISLALHTKEEITSHYVRITEKNGVSILYTTDGVSSCFAKPGVTLDVSFTIKNHKKHKEVTKNLIYVVLYGEELPDTTFIEKEVDMVIAYTMLTRQGKRVDKYLGPVLLAGQPSGVFFHEVIGHRLEASRLLTKNERSGLQGDEELTNPDIVFSDDPSMRYHKQRWLIGGYDFDEEGVAPKNTVLMSRGRAINFLTTRTATSGAGHRSNGHARSDCAGLPSSRMGVSIIRSANEKLAKDWDELKAELLYTVKEQKLPFGVIVLRADHGETTVDSWDIQAYRGGVDLMLLLHANGTLSAASAMDFVGVPLMALKSVTHIGNKTTESAENHGCGSESGWVAVSTISRAVLIHKSEMQPQTNDHESPVLPHPKFT